MTLPSSLRVRARVLQAALLLVLAFVTALTPFTTALAGACPPAMPFASLSDRIGVNVTLDYGRNVDDYDTTYLRAGWYIDYARRHDPSTPGGMAYVQVLRTAEFDSIGWRSVIGSLIDANPGGVWAIGNEMDRNGQDGRLPSRYAVIYHDAYFFIKGRDRSATVMVGSLVQPTPARLRYMDLVLEAYQNIYGKRMPVEYWNTHGFILREVGEYGAFMPPGLEIWTSFAPDGGFVALRNLAVGDFNGDGASDIFRVNGGQWLYYPNATGSPQNLATDFTPLADLRFGDFDGDGKTDVFRVNGSQWQISFGGATGWNNLGGPGAPLSEIAFGDFNGDGKLDIFSISGGQWRYSPGGASGWVNLANDPTPLANLRFGDFNGDGKTDAFSKTGNQWRYLPGATVNQIGVVEWRLLLNDEVRSLPFNSLSFGDFNGDRRTDVFGIFEGRWSASLGGNGNWRGLSTDPTPLAELRFGDFDGDGVTDLFTARDGEWYLSYAAQSEVGPEPWTIADHGNIEIFKGLIVDFRRWMAERGYRDTPLVVSEYGILMPSIYTSYTGQKYNYEFVRDYMLDSFRFMAETKNPAIGYARDENRLVQAWAWYSLNDLEYTIETERGFNGNLFDHDTATRQRLAIDFRNFTSTDYVQYTDVTLRELEITPSSIVSPTPPISIHFNVSAINRGNLVANGLRVQFYLGEPGKGGVLLGQSSRLDTLGVRCGDAQNFSFTWEPGTLDEGFYRIYAVVTYQNDNREFDAANNTAVGFVRVGPPENYHDLFVPIFVK